MKKTTSTFNIYMNYKKYLLVFILFNFFASIRANAQENIFENFNNSSSDETLYDKLNERKHYLAALPSVSSADPKDCQNKWSVLLKDAYLDIVITLGYSDQEFQNTLFANDTLYQKILENHLTEPCFEGYYACGFEKKEDGLFIKNISQNHSKFALPYQVRIQLVSSSASLLDADNRNSLKQTQTKKSLQAQEKYNNGIKNADIVFYQGHARAGGGPDFSPPVLNNGTNHVNYSWYLANRPGLKMTLNSLKTPGRKSKLLALFACDSEKHFKKILKSTAPDLGLILIQNLAEQELVQISMVGAIDSIIAGKCQNNFQKSLFVSDYPNKAVILSNFF